MSQMTAATARAGARAPHRRTAPTPSLRVVSGADARRSGAGFAVLCITLLACGLLGLLVLNTAVATGSFKLHDLQVRSGQLTDTQDALTQQIAVQSSPQELARRALAMGMVPSQSAAFLRLSDGKVLGVAATAQKDKAFTVVSQTPPAKPGGPSAAKAATTKAASSAGSTTATATQTPGAPPSATKPATTR